MSLNGNFWRNRFCRDLNQAEGSASFLEGQRAIHQPIHSSHVISSQKVKMSGGPMRLEILQSPFYIKGLTVLSPRYDQQTGWDLETRRTAPLFERTVDQQRLRD